MKLDNRKNIFKLWIRKFIEAIILTLLIIVFGFSDFFKNPVLGLHNSVYIIITVAAYLTIILSDLIKKPNYVYFSDNGDKIILRFYPVRIFNSKKSSIEIPKQSFVSWEVEKFFFGRYELIFLTGNYKTGIVRFPGVSLSAVNPEDREKIKSVLSQHAGQARKKFIPGKKR